MAATTKIRVSDQLRKLPTAVRSTVQAARRAVRAAAPQAREVPYSGEPPRSKSAMWKLTRYVMEGSEGYVVAIGALRDHASFFFPRGRELDDGAGLLQGDGKQFRFIRLHAPGDADRDAVRRILRKAFRLGSQTSKQSAEG